MNVRQSYSSQSKIRLALEFFIIILLFQCDLVSTQEPEEEESKKSFRFITSHIHNLQQCNKYLTFLASIAVGAFATKVLHESPLTPLPLPPLDDPPRWNLLTLPAHMAAPFFHWMRKHGGSPFYTLQRYDNVISPWYPEMGSGNTILDHPVAWKIPSDYSTDHHLLRFRRHLTDKAMIRTIKPLKFLPHLLGIRKFLSRWCP